MGCESVRIVLTYTALYQIQVLVVGVETIYLQAPTSEKNTTSHVAMNLVAIMKEKGYLLSAPCAVVRLQVVTSCIMEL